MIKTAIIGCGMIASGYDKKWPQDFSLTHAGAFELCPTTRLVAVADINGNVLSSFREKWGVNHLYQDYRQLLENEEIDILVISTPTQMHYQVFMDAVANDIPAIILEKPICYDFVEAGSMLAAATGKVVAVNFIRRWNKTIHSLRDRIERGDYGRAISFTNYYPKGVASSASHAIDLASWFLGGVDNITTINTQMEKDHGDKIADFSINFKNGSKAFFISVEGIDYHFFDVDIICEKARFILTQRSRELYSYFPVHDNISGLFKVLGKPRIKETDWKNCASYLVEDVVRCMKTGKKPKCSLLEGIDNLKICNQVFTK